MIMKKKLQLSGRLKVKSFTTIIDKTEQKTTKGGYLNKASRFGIQDPWTEIKSGKGHSLRVVNDGQFQLGKGTSDKI